jgi:ribosomal protein S18 acetylase RimI-like enzyme
LASESTFRVEPFDKQQGRDSFRCGVEALDRYLREQASQDKKKRVAGAFVLVEDGTERIAGYFTLSATSILTASLPPELAKKLPRYESMPGSLIGRLAVDQSFQGQGIGKTLLHAAMKQSLGATRVVESWAVVVDAKDEAAKKFYERHGFLPLEDRPMRLFFPMKSVAQMFPDFPG